LIYFKITHWAFIVAIDPAGTYINCQNINEKIKDILPNVIFQTALPMKEKCPWSKNPEDIKVIINECKSLFNVIELDC
jgi:hypothetical protein